MVIAHQRCLAPFVTRLPSRAGAIERDEHSRVPTNGHDRCLPSHDIPVSLVSNERRRQYQARAALTELEPIAKRLASWLF